MNIEKIKKFKHFLIKEESEKFIFLGCFLFFKQVDYWIISRFFNIFKKKNFTEALKVLPDSQLQIQVYNIQIFVDSSEFVGKNVDIYKKIKELCEDCNQNEFSLFFLKIDEVSTKMSPVSSIEKNKIQESLNVFFTNIFLYYVYYSFRNDWTALLDDFFNIKNYKWQVKSINTLLYSSTKDINGVLAEFVMLSLFLSGKNEKLINGIGFFFKKTPPTLKHETEEERVEYSLSLLKSSVLFTFLPFYSHIFIAYFTKEKKIISSDKELYTYLKSLDYEKINNDTYIIFDKEKADKLSFLYNGNGVFYNPIETSFKKNNDQTVINVINNKCYSNHIWIRKNDDLYVPHETDNEEKKNFFSARVKGLQSFLNGVNHLQNTRLKINLENLEYIKNFYYQCLNKDVNWFINLKGYEKIFFDIGPEEIQLSENFWVKAEDRKIKKFKVSENLKKKMPDYLNFIGDNFLIEPKNFNKLSKLVSSIITIRELDFIAFHSKNGFYYKQASDTRTRNYPTASAVNYQNSRICRALLQVTQEECDIIKTFVFFIEKNKHILEFRSFNYQHLDVVNTPNFVNLIKFKYPNIANTDLIKKLCSSKLTLNVIKENAQLIILIEQLCDIFYRIGNITFVESQSVRTFSSIIEEGASLAVDILDSDSDKELMQLTFSYIKKEKKFWEWFFLFKELKKFFTSDNMWLDYCWYNDASSNVIQLKCFKLHVWDEHLLKVSNIFTNDTPYKNIYNYVAAVVKEDIKFKDIDGDIIKQVIMPGAYGQKELSFIIKADEMLKDNEQSAWKNLLELDENFIFETKKDWKTLSKSDKNKEMRNVLNKIEKEVWKFFEKNNFPIKLYLDLCKQLPIENRTCRWFNYIGMPVIIEKFKTEKHIALKTRSEELYNLKKKFYFIKSKDPAFFSYLQDRFILKIKFLYQNTLSKVELEKKTRSSALFKKFLYKTDLVDFHGFFLKENCQSVTKISKFFDIEKFINLALNQELKLKVKSNASEKDNKRKNLALIFNQIDLSEDFNEKNELKKVYVKKRDQSHLTKIDTNKLVLALPPACNHADDASILIKCMETLSFYNIKACGIHDSIGTHIGYSYISKMNWKLENLNFILKQLEKEKEEPFPFNELSTEFKNKNFEEKRKTLMQLKKTNKEIYIKNIKKIEKEIIESRNFFN